MARTIDIAVIGGGVSGVYSAWRLKKKNPDLAIEVFEASERVGGRLLSARPPGIPSIHAELGGMRYMSDQTWVASLVRHLGLETYPFPVSEPSNIAYLRGHWLRDSQFRDPEEVPYSLNWAECGKTAGELVIGAIEQVVPGITKTNDLDKRAQMARDATFAGRPLNEQGFWQVLYRVMSPEAYELAVDAGGYQTTLTNWNAADAIPWYLRDFGLDVEYFAFKGGFEQLPREVARRFEDRGGVIHRGHSLKGFRGVERPKEGPFALRFARDPEPVIADRVILGMPRRSLELISSPLLRDRRVRRLVSSVTPRPLFKLFCCYDYPWYEPAGVKQGKSNTDLPVRQCYYFGVEGEQKGSSCPESTNTLVMASYDDGLNIGFWDGFRETRNAEKRAAIRLAKDFYYRLRDYEPCSAGDGPGPNWESHQAPAAMVEEVNRQLAVLHDLEYLPEPYAAAYQDWGKDPYGGGWNSWNIGEQSARVKHDIVQPIPDVEMYIVGEAYSNAQGWVEGALDTSEDMLNRFFGLKKPGWYEEKAPQPSQTPYEQAMRAVEEGLEPLREAEVDEIGSAIEPFVRKK